MKAEGKINITKIMNYFIINSTIKKGLVCIIYAFYFKQSYTDISSISVKNKYTSNENKGKIPCIGMVYP